MDSFHAGNQFTDRCCFHCIGSNRNTGTVSYTHLDVYKRQAYAVKTTTVSELISGMDRIHMPKEVTIPLTVMFRFFPTVFQESEAISDAMKMRGIKMCIRDSLQGGQGQRPGTDRQLSRLYHVRCF